MISHYNAGSMGLAMSFAMPWHGHGMDLCLSDDHHAAFNFNHRCLAC